MIKSTIKESKSRSCAISLTFAWRTVPPSNFLELYNYDFFKKYIFLLFLTSVDGCVSESRYIVNFFFFFFEKALHCKVIKVNKYIYF